MKQPIAASIALAALTFTLASPAIADHHEASEQAGNPWTGFRAGGNEPFWSLTFGETDMAFEHIGTVSAQAPRTDAQVTLNGTVFMGRSEDGEQRDFVVLVEDHVCSDSMSGRPYPKSVRVFVEGMHFSGCGGDTEELLTGAAWQVTSLRGNPVADSVTQTLEFDSEGGLSGTGGCNRYTTRYELGEGIDFGPIASTRMACPGSNAGQLENQLFTALGAVISFEIGDDGGLALFDENGPVLTAQR